MASNATINGKSFEFACLESLYSKLKKNQDVCIIKNKPYETAKKSFRKLTLNKQFELVRAADVATKMLLQLEPRLIDSDNKSSTLYLSIQSDAQGIKGDIRDIVCYREKPEKWEIGISCKINNKALKHSRLSETIDFGKEWFDIECSQQYFEEIRPIFNELSQMREMGKKTNEKILWSDLPNKETHYYRPILQAFMNELDRIVKKHPEVPSILIQYLIGRTDSHRIIMDKKHSVIEVETINPNKTLTQSSRFKNSIVKTSRLNLPTKIYHLDFKNNSNSTIELVFDEGWSLSLRIHNASKFVEPSLKFDIRFISTPNSIHSLIEPY